MTTNGNDPHGYERLLRALDFLVVEAGSAGIDADVLRAARRFSTGSPTEFLGESLMALETFLGHRDRMQSSVAAFAEAVVAEIREGFDRIDRS